MTSSTKAGFGATLSRGREPRSPVGVQTPPKGESATPDRKPPSHGWRLLRIKRPEHLKGGDRSTERCGAGSPTDCAEQLGARRVCGSIVLEDLMWFCTLRGMAGRNEARANEARDELRQIVGFSAADEIEKLNRLKSTGSISEREYARLKVRIVQ